MQKIFRNKTFIGWVVGIVIAGTVFAYVPLLFLPTGEPATLPEDQIDTSVPASPIVTSTDSAVTTRVATGTEEQAPSSSLPLRGPLRLP